MAPASALLSLFKVDPDLGAELTEPAAAEAARQLVVRAASLEAGPCPERWGPDDTQGALGLLVLAGLLLREVEIAGNVAAELVGPRDLVRPWDVDHGAGLPLGARSRWTVLQPAQVAVLDGRFVRAASRWPEVLSALCARGLWRARTIALRQAIVTLPRVQDRLLFALWHVAERWGRVSLDGVVVPVDLTHELLARLVGARRPSVTTALGSLARRGLVQRRPDRAWLLLGPMPGGARVGAGRAAGDPQPNVSSGAATG